MITCRDYWRVMNGGYLHNPHFSFCPLFRLRRIRGKSSSDEKRSSRFSSTIRQFVYFMLLIMVLKD